MYRRKAVLYLTNGGFGGREVDVASGLIRGKMGQGVSTEKVTPSGRSLPIGLNRDDISMPGMELNSQTPSLRREHEILNVGWAEDFLFAGTSALLLLCANLFPAYWFVSFIALIPLLYRIVKAEPRRALRLGFLFGVSFLGVSLTYHGFASPLASLAAMVGGTTLFALFGWAVAHGRRQWGFNPLVIALFWIALELGVIRLGFTQGLLAEGSVGHPLFQGMAALFGFLSISFIIVLFNILLIYALETVAALAASGEPGIAQRARQWDLTPSPRPTTLRLFLVPEGRGPPVC